MHWELILGDTRQEVFVQQRICIIPRDPRKLKKLRAKAHRAVARCPTGQEATVAFPKKASQGRPTVVVPAAFILAAGPGDIFRYDPAAGMPVTR